MLTKATNGMTECVKTRVSYYKIISSTANWHPFGSNNNKKAPVPKEGVKTVQGLRA